jgi:putative RNA 2'-phosphotransferase
VKPVYKCAVCGSFTEEPVHCGNPAVLLLGAAERVKLSKLVSGILRHFHQALGVELDAEGFADVSDLAKAVSGREGYEWVRPEHIVALALLDPKGRFELRGNRIRARYGHSVRVCVRYPEEYPDTPLYHGTSRSKLPSILERGLLPMGRLFVHLSVDPADAAQRASRFPDPVVLVVDPRRMRGRARLYRASAKVYVAERVPPDCIVAVLDRTKLAGFDRAGNGGSQPP